MATNLGGLEKEQLFTAKFIYDVPLDGGAAGTYNLNVGFIPENALVVNGGLYVQTAFAGGTSMSLGVLAAADLSAAILTATLVADYAVAFTPVFATGTTWIKTGASNRGLIVVIVGTMTAGRAVVWLDYRIVK